MRTEHPRSTRHARNDHTDVEIVSNGKWARRFFSAGPPSVATPTCHLVKLSWRSTRIFDESVYDAHLGVSNSVLKRFAWVSGVPLDIGCDRNRLTDDDAVVWLRRCCDDRTRLIRKRPLRMSILTRELRPQKFTFYEQRS